ncbi:hypothetical protein TL16_g02292 [Triparma laevis f. inornata]|uniref:Uncharacterized protein n=1 Tax=Triparma laevis f. inornata TaxID=1714386 RepID=A0A9W7DWV8_9STRA|nr:hypothetical protein TL16_g02292 [Triparma laevis f. inornata]
MQCSPRSGLIMRVFNDESSFDPAESPCTAKQYTKEMVWGSVSPPVVEFVNGASSLLPGDCESYYSRFYSNIEAAPPNAIELTNDSSSSELPTPSRISSKYNEKDNWIATVGTSIRSNRAPLVNPLGAYLISAANATGKHRYISAKVTFKVPSVASEGRPIYRPHSHDIRFGVVMTGNRAGSMQTWSALSFSALKTDENGVAIIYVVGQNVEVEDEECYNVIRWPVGGEDGSNAGWPAIIIEQYLAQSQRLERPEFTSAIADVVGESSVAANLGMGEYAPTVEYFESVDDMKFIKT